MRLSKPSLGSRNGHFSRRLGSLRHWTRQTAGHRYSVSVRRRGRKAAPRQTRGEKQHRPEEEETTQHHPSEERRGTQLHPEERKKGNR